MQSQPKPQYKKELDPDRMIIKSSDRVFVVGTTGSGKTKLVQALLWNQPNVMVLDPKRMFSYPKKANYDYTIATTMAEVEKWDEPGMLVYRPSPEEVDATMCDAWFRHIFERENTRGFVDEVAMIANAHRQPTGMKYCIQQGRERNVGLWMATQRPSQIPTNCLTESEHVLAFRLRNEDDQKRVARYTVDEIANKPSTGHGFWYYNDPKQVLVYYDHADIGPLLT